MKDLKFKEPNKNHPLPYLKYGAFYIYKSDTEKYPEMVEVSKGPKWGRSVIGKKYINIHFSLLAIDTLSTEHKIDSSKKEAVADLEKEGFDTDASLDSDDDVF